MVKPFSVEAILTLDAQLQELEQAAQHNEELTRLYQTHRQILARCNESTEFQIGAQRLLDCALQLRELADQLERSAVGLLEP